MKIREYLSWTEMIFAALLLLATLSSAFCVYEASQWTGIQNQLYTESMQMKTESAIAQGETNRHVMVDVTVFLSWVDAKSQNDTFRADFLESRFTPEFKPAFDAWRATREKTGTIPPDTPFSRPEYRLSAQDKSDQLDKKAELLFEEGNKANELGGEYILITVLFTLVLFLCGVGEKWEAPQIQRLILIFAGFMFVIAMGAVLWITMNNGI